MRKYNSSLFQCEVDETTDVATEEQLSVIIRLDKKGDVVERFLEVYNVSSDCTC